MSRASRDAADAASVGEERREIILMAIWDGRWKKEPTMSPGQWRANCGDLGAPVAFLDEINRRKGRAIREFDESRRHRFAENVRFHTEEERNDQGFPNSWRSWRMSM